ncbi:MAG: CBS domain-containing protein [Hyphomicrobiales bacterium]
MNVEHLMQRAVETCTPETTLTDASMVMWRRDCGFVPVVEQREGRLVGIVTDRDICMATATRHLAPDAIRVEDVMTRGGITCAPGESIHAAAHRMAESQVRRLPVIDLDRRVVGILSLNDLALSCEPTRGRAEGLSYADVMGVLKAVSAHRIGAIEPIPTPPPTPSPR